MKISDFQRKKIIKEKITMITCYDYTAAKLLADTEVDCLLVGDSVAMVMHGYQDTLSATLPMMCMHASAVRRGAGAQFIVVDLPFLSYRQSQRQTVKAVQALLQHGAAAVKLEGARGNLTMIRHLVESGVPVMGHLGLTPQFIHQLGGFKVQGKTADSANQLINDAILLQQAGCFAIVLECVPSALAATISAELVIPTIGIGAGPETDGQVLVWQDLLGMTTGYVPKFVKSFLAGETLIKNSVNDYVAATRRGEFPSDIHCYNHC
jgi:3-methyl-2-oxobutanoate hydroxymethyltransferase